MRTNHFDNYLFLLLNRVLKNRFDFFLKMDVAHKCFLVIHDYVVCFYDIIMTANCASILDLIKNNCMHDAIKKVFEVYTLILVLRLYVIIYSAR